MARILFREGNDGVVRRSSISRKGIVDGVDRSLLSLTGVAEKYNLEVDSGLYITILFDRINSNSRMLAIVPTQEGEIEVFKDRIVLIKGDSVTTVQISSSDVIPDGIEKVGIGYSTVHCLTVAPKFAALYRHNNKLLVQVSEDTVKMVEFNHKCASVGSIATLVNKKYFTGLINDIKDPAVGSILSEETDKQEIIYYDGEGVYI